MPLFHEPACLFVITMSIIPKKHSLKRALPTAYFASEGFGFVPPFACGEIAHGNSVVHCIAIHPSIPLVQHSILRRWLQQMACCLECPSHEPIHSLSLKACHSWLSNKPASFLPQGSSGW